MPGVEERVRWHGQRLLSLTVRRRHHTSTFGPGAAGVGLNLGSTRALEQPHWGTALFCLFKERRRKGSLRIISCVYIQLVVFSQNEAFSTRVDMSTLTVQSRFCHTHSWHVSWIRYPIKQTIADARNIPTYRYLNTIVSASTGTTV